MLFLVTQKIKMKKKPLKQTFTSLILILIDLLINNFFQNAGLLKLSSDNDNSNFDQPVYILLYSGTSCFWDNNRLGFVAEAELLNLSSYDVW